MMHMLSRSLRKLPIEGRFSGGTFLQRRTIFLPLIDINIDNDLTLLTVLVKQSLLG